MARAGLYQFWSFNLDFPQMFSDAPKVSTEAYSRFASSTTTPRATLHAPTMHAILAYINLVLSDADPDDGPKSGGALGVQNENYCVGEYIRSDGSIECVVFMRSTGTFSACTLSSFTSSPQMYVIGEKKEDGAGFIFSLMPLIVEDEEFAENLGILSKGIKDLDWDTDKVTDKNVLNAMYVLCDNIYRRIETSAVCGDFAIQTNIPDSGNIPLLAAMAISSGTYSPTEILHGTFNVIKPGDTSRRAAAAVKSDDFEGRYSFSKRTFTPAEQFLIPKLQPWYVIPKEVIKVCEHAKKTTGGVIPMRNFMLRGPSGTGKTEGARAIAAGLGLPYMHLTCGADDEKFDFVGQILPEFKDGDTEATSASIELPSEKQCESDPVNTYFEMTGDYDTEVTAEAVLALRQSKLDEFNKAKAETPDSSTPSYRYIKTQLITAMENGYLIEIQEPSVILKAGVLVSLNSLFDTSSSSIQLMTGETIQRHPDAVVVITTNTNYEGCRQMNQSIISRMNLVIDMDKIDAKVMAERAMKITGCTDKTMVTTMAQVVFDINEAYRDTMDGVCGMRELISWVQSYMICESALEAATDTVISSFSADREARDEMKDAFIKNKFAA